MVDIRVSCIIPAYNEESTIRDILRMLKKIKRVNEIIVVDDGSTDGTYKIAKAERVVVVRHEKNRGKGAAIKTGIKNSQGDILLFLDADLKNLSPRQVMSILNPIRNGDADFVKSTFTRKRGRVTELVVKPLFRVVSPLIHFKQPLSGQFAIKRELLKDIKIDDEWGVDVRILLEMVEKGIRIAEVDIGNIVHKKQPIEKLSVMSEQVIKTILSEVGIIANKHRLIIFDFDRTLIKGSSIEFIAKEFGFERELENLRNSHSKGKIKDYEITLNLAKLLKGRTVDDIERVCEKIRLQNNVERVIDRLKKRRYELAIISLAYSPVINFFAKKLGIDTVVCPFLVADRKGRFTGEVVAKTKYNSECCDRIICKGDTTKEIMRKFRIKQEECIGVGDGKSDECLFRACGLSLSYKSKNGDADIKINNISEVLVYAE